MLQSASGMLALAVILGDVMRCVRQSRAVAGAMALAATLIFCGPALAQAAEFLLPTAGCPMAHCDARMSNQVQMVGPAVGAKVFIEMALAGAKSGLGCVSNTRIVACTGGGNPTVESNLAVYDGDGRRIWQDGGILGATAFASVAMIGVDGQVIAADQRWILRADPLARKVLWRARKPDRGIPISPVLVGGGADMVLLATLGADSGGSAELSVWDARTGSLLSHQAIVDSISGKAYNTLNTPAVRGGRAYVLTSARDAPEDGRLYAVDICESASCGGRGVITPVWHFDFVGPSGASPLLIGQRLFFDGRRGSGASTYLSVEDLGAAPLGVWSKRFSGRFDFNAAQDPRGGLWVAPWGSGLLLRLSEDTGAVGQSIDVGPVLGLGAGYTPATTVSVTSSQHGAVVLTFGAQNAGSGDAPTFVAAIDVSSTQAGAMLWKYKVSTSASLNAPTGQTPVVISSSGARRVVFRGTKSATFFVGEP